MANLERPTKNGKTLVFSKMSQKFVLFIHYPDKEGRIMAQFDTEEQAMEFAGKSLKYNPQLGFYNAERR